MSDREQGMQVRREVLGDEHVDRATANTTPFTEPFQDFITRYAWGEIWSRPGLDRKTRSCITLAALVSLRADEIAEVLLHTAIYAGVPAANRAFAIANEVLEEATGHRP